MPCFRFCHDIKARIARPVLLVLLAMLTTHFARAEFDVEATDRALFKILKFQKGRPESKGSGFLVNERGIVATNYHVTEGSDQLYLAQLQPDKIRIWKASVIYESADKDICLIQGLGLTGKPVILNPLLPSKGADVVAMGFPGQLDLETEEHVFLQALIRNNFNDMPINDSYVNFVRSSVKKGNIEDVRKQPWGKSNAPIMAILHNAPISGGNSGGPLFNAQGQVIGINTLIKGEKRVADTLIGNIFSLSSSIAELTAILTEVKISFQTAGSGSLAAAAPDLGARESRAMPKQDPAGQQAAAATLNDKPVGSKNADNPDSTESSSKVSLAKVATISVIGLVVLGTLFQVLRKRAPVAATPAVNRRLGDDVPPPLPARLAAAPARPSLINQLPEDEPFAIDRTRKASSPNRIAARPAMAYKQWVISGSDIEGNSHSLNLDTTAFAAAHGTLGVGRSSNCPLVIRNTSLSRLHAEFVLDQQGILTIRDRGSSNGTRVNGKSLVPENDVCPLKHGDALELGEVRLRIEEVK